MALPTDPATTREETLARRRAAEEEALLREVDDAVRQDDMADFGKRYGRPLAFGVGALLLAFGGYLFWQDRRDAGYQTQSEALVSALDQAQAGNFAAAGEQAKPLSADSSPGVGASARLLAAGAAMQQGRTDEAASILSALAADSGAPGVMRDLARLRLVAMQFDTMDKAQIVAQLTPMARPDNPWFGSAGELLAMAYLEQGKRDEAGRLFASVAGAESVPDPIRTRARQMAGVLGVDAITDVDKFMQQQQQRQQASDARQQAAAQPPAA